MRSHNDLDAWKRSIDFTLDIYRATSAFPKEEKYGLTSQICRASVSISANIAEGAGRKSDKEFIHFLSNAQGSASEVETELLIGYKLGYLREAEYQQLSKCLDDIGRMITGLSNHLRRKSN